MMSIPLLKRNLVAGLKLMIPFIAILTMYNTIIIWMYDPELSKSLQEFQEIMPQMMAAVGMMGSTGTMIEFMHTYLYGFIMLFVPVIYVIMVVNKLIMSYVDSGSAACILATPNSRSKLIRTQLFSAGLLIVILIAVMTVIGYICSEFMFSGELDVKKYMALNGATMLFDLTVSGICVFAACLFNEAKWYLSVGAGLPLFFYVVQMMANMGDKLEKLKYATIFTLFPGQKIVEGADGIVPLVLALAVIWIVLYVAGGMIFTRKDLSV